MFFVRCWALACLAACGGKVAEKICQKDGPATIMAAMNKQALTWITTLTKLILTLAKLIFLRLEEERTTLKKQKKKNNLQLDTN